MEISVDLPTDPDGYTNQECSSCGKRFKVKFVKNSKNRLDYCPYCGSKEENFLTDEQVKSVKEQAVAKALGPMLRDAASRLNSASGGFVKLRANAKYNSYSIPLKEKLEFEETKSPCCNEGIKVYSNKLSRLYCISCGKIYKSVFAPSVKKMPSYNRFATSYKRYKDYADNVLNSDYNTFRQNLHIFLNHLERDGHLSPIAKTLNSFPDLFDAWWDQAQKSQSSFVGSAKFILPDDDDQRLALLYQICKKMDSDEIRFDSIGSLFSIASNLTDMVHDINKKFFTPMLKLLNYKIDELEEAIRNDESNLDNPQKYNQIVQTIIVHGGHNVFGGDGSTNIQVIHQMNDLDKAIKALKEDVPEIKQNAEASTLVDEIAAIAKKNENKLEAAEKISKLSKLVPKTKEYLKKIASSAGVGVASNVVIEGIKFVLGLN